MTNRSNRRNRTNRTYRTYRTYGTYRTNKTNGANGLCWALWVFLLLILPLTAKGQITIGGNVYGGGNEGYVSGNTTVTVRAGNIGARSTDSEEPVRHPAGKVFGGARMANVGGNAFVHIDGEHASDSMVINHVYGGNDIAGIIGDNPNAITRLPKELKDAQAHSVDSTWNSFVLVTTKADTTVAGKAVEVSKAPKIFIGQLFGGGNGDYAYEDVQDEDSVTHNIYAKPKLSSDDPVAWKKTPKGDAGFVVPDLAKSYLDIHGGTITYAYGGGNNATVTEKNIICVNNPSGVVTSVYEGDENLLTTPRFKEMGINTSLSHPTSDEFQIGCLFGGNNKDTMAIRPTWYLQDGSVRSLFSGGNRGAMIYEHGLYLNIPETSTIVVNDLFGGCRMADVRPQKKNPTTGVYEDVDEVDNDIVGYNFPRNLAARVLIAGGDVRNVYGGNDVRGKVYFGNAIGIHASVRGNVYGGGNGAYAYTDISDYENDDIWGDYYYTADGYSSSAEALNDIRPNAEQVSILLRGTEEKKTIIGGSVFVGGNCATLKSDEKHKHLANYPLAELKIGSHVIAKNVYLGNNGESMVSEDILRRYKNEEGTFSSMNLTDPSVFPEYMKGVTMSHLPRMLAEDTKKGDRLDYDPYTTYIGSLYYGGNRGSMTYPGTLDITPEVPIYIYDKLVAGCNNANIAATEYNARYEGGILGDESEQGSYTDEHGNIKDRIHMNLSKIKLLPMRLNDEGTALEWNTVNLDKDGNYVPEIIKRDTLKTGMATAWDKTRRLVGANVYGGCNESGHVNGNVVISLKGTLHDRHAIFDAFEGEEKDDDILYDLEDYTITSRKSGVILNEQGMDVLGEALNVYGGGKGKDTEIWGSTTVNLERGYTFQIFGGSENGAIGKGTWHDNAGESDTIPTGYVYPTVPDAKYSTTVNLNCQRKGVQRSLDSSEEMAEAEFIYGGNNTGIIVGNTHVNLNNGRLFNSWGGSCNADILGYAETHIGESGFPYLRDHIYGANDLGGRIFGTKDFSSCIRDYAGDKAKIFGYDSKSPDAVPDVLTASSYVEYIQGNIKNIFGGCFGEYDYDGDFKDVKLPWIDNAFVNIRPINNNESRLAQVFGAGQGNSGNYPNHEGDFMQDRSYVFIDIPQDMTNFTSTAVFGAGRSNGLGMRTALKIEPMAKPAEGATNQELRDYEAYLKKLPTVSAIVDLIRGQVGNVYGGSYEEGIVRRSVVNVPEGSTIEAKNIFGGGYGVNVDIPCDVYESQVNYNSENAAVKAIFGGNNNADRTLYTQVNIRKPVWTDKEQTSLATVYGAGYGEDSWAQYTEVNLLKGARVGGVYGGGYNGKVINLETLNKWKSQDAALELGMHSYTDTGLKNALALETALGGKYNTNVHINDSATVVGYAYGGGLGSDTIPNSGNVYGTTYIDVLGGTVTKDLSAAGTTGSVQNWFREGKNTTGGYKADGFTASATAYIQGGTVRNVYGGGYRGNVGWHDGKIYENVSDQSKPDVPGKSYVVIGKPDGKSYVDGIPSITRNVYGGGEGGAVYGCANIKVNNGYIGYRYENKAYVEELHDKAPGDSLLAKGGNIFGGGYVANSYVDSTHIEMYGGVVRGCLHGGGEIGPIGRGSMKADATQASGSIKTEAGATIYKAGKTLVQLYDGWVKRDVFGGGRGYDNWGGEGWMTEEEKATMDRSAKGYVFGQTEVDIYGGEVGTDVSVALGQGNVFGGGDIGFVHSAYENSDHKLSIGKKSGQRFNDSSGDGYYYKNENGSFVTVSNEKVLTEDCKVLVEPWCKANEAITLGGKSFKVGEFVPTSYLHYLGNKEDADWKKLSKTDPNKEGIIIHNAVFAGGNTSSGSSVVHANTTTVYGNATASIHDVYHRDLITIGTGHTGGLYGDGNLTLVDGYRELNITNYGTDYYSITPEITRAQYDALPKREGAYYEIRYKCKKTCKDKDGKTYGEGSTITYDDLVTLFLRFNNTDKKYYSLTDGESGPAILVYNETSKSWEPNNATEATYWVENGVCSRYAGRIMNTIQRADFCGVYGSRMVMQGAQDRVPETVDYTNYTINRVREVSLNKKTSVRSIDTDSRQQHGNYFGIYNTVNYLGALTSDVDFGGDGATSAAGAVRTTENDDTETYQCNAGDGGKAYGTATYYDWKAAFHNDRKRNNGSSYNKVALSSGVYLELTTEQSKGDSLYGKDWGYITGVVELDLINVQPGVGGGFVYAKNVHGKRYATGLKQLTLTALNTDAVSRKKYRYDEDDTKKEEWQTSGNFVHSSQTIIDDCYNQGGKYKSQYKAPNGVPAHYWYIKGSIYVYDQYISAYTGTPNAYSEVVNIPLTITSASHGKMTLMNIMPNRYAYYANSAKEKLSPTSELVLHDVEYRLNDPISYWDYCLLSQAERELFVEQTYVTSDSCKIGDKYYPKGYVMLKSEYETFEEYANNHKQVLEEDTPAVPAVLLATKNGSGADIVKQDETGHDVYRAFTDVFHESNNMRHETGYILTYNVNNPELWYTWYSPKTGDSQTLKIDTKKYEETTDKTNYENGPTYTPRGTGLYGQEEYKVGNIISEGIHTTYTTAWADESLTQAKKDSLGKQATFERAWIVTTDILETQNENNVSQRFYKGAALVESDYTDVQWTAMSGKVAPAYVVTNTITLGTNDYIYRDTRMTESEKTTLYNKYNKVGATDEEKAIAAEIEKCIVPAYYCTSEGSYGGELFKEGNNYRAMSAFSSMSEEDRQNFIFNYDALDLLVDSAFTKAEGAKYQYDGYDTTTGVDYSTPEEAKLNKAHYSLQTPIDYTATYKAPTVGASITYMGDDNKEKTATDGTVLSRTEFEGLLNERYYYSPISVKKDKDGHLPEYYYIVNKTIVLGDTPYAAGQVISSATYSELSDDDKTHVTKLKFTEQEVGTYFYCRESYTIADEANGGKEVNNYMSEDKEHPDHYTYGQTVPTGVILTESDYEGLTNKQANFSIHGTSPTETSTLYVTRNSDINDLSTEKIITVIYQYDYVETDMGGMNITPVSERHILNIHINFKSGVPTVEDILAPDIVLPGTSISINEPFVSPGAYQVTGGGWELFDNDLDAESHSNGVEYTPNNDPLFLYQDSFLVAYYAKTYLGKTYSNAVPVRVANYHDLKKVMSDLAHHYYIDHKDMIDKKKIEPKIYINDYSKDAEGSKNGLDLFKNLYDLTVLSSSPAETTSPIYGHTLLNKSTVGGGKNLEFFLRTDIDHSTSTWTPIGSTDDDGPCFDGTFHGDGHYLSGLNQSLFNHLCGDVFNLGVSGTFTGAGIAEHGSGYLENCWMSTTSTAAKTHKPVFNTPSRTSEQIEKRGPIQIVNCYYAEEDNATNKYTNHAANSTYGTAVRKPAKAFYNGEVAYDLNGFYLFKRYSDHQSGTGVSYNFWKNGETALQTGKYFNNDASICSTGNGGVMYVEDRFADGDFIYDGGNGGVIPTVDDVRLHTFKNSNGETVRKYYPIWPDDYLYFGQSLNYGYVDGLSHDSVPSAIKRSGNYVATDMEGNRVYRAPAYFRNDTMRVAHFNPNAIFAPTDKNKPTKVANKGMTAIDFTDKKYGSYPSYRSYAAGWIDGTADGLDKMFYPPLLDDDGLTGFRNADLTQNLLVYTAATGENKTAAEKTATVVSNYLLENVYEESADKYRNVAYQTSASVHGHWVENGIATRSHQLVDKQDFNAPLSYKFDDGLVMWYQRYPDDDEFVDRKKGWQAISLPFTAELVTTDQKGEITHFYSGSETSKNGTGTKIGHEYWLREMANGSTMTLPEGETNVLTAAFNHPTSKSSDLTKTVQNTFLWDHYYKGVSHNQRDYNNDTYQDYYSKTRPYEKYPLLAKGTPYLLGLPGATYFEFDLSGSFDATTTATTRPAKIEKQTITFVSNKGATISVSDKEAKTSTATYGNTNYLFKPSYLNMDFEAETPHYVLADVDTDSDGKTDVSRFNKVSAATSVYAFRPYFMAVGDETRMTRSIGFGMDADEMNKPQAHKNSEPGTLTISAGYRSVIVESALRYETEVRVVTTNGVTLNTFKIKPGEIITTRVNLAGVYIVQTTDQEYTKKIAVK